MKLSLKNILIVGLIVFVITSGFARKWLFEAGPLNNNVYILVAKGSGTYAVANKLYKEGIINKPWLFKLAARFMKLDKKLKAGEYHFAPSISMFDVIQKLANGNVVYRKITLAEGLTTIQMLQIINEEEMLTGNITLTPKDGELLPETYTFMRGDTRDSIVLQAQNAMKNAVDIAWNRRDDKLPLKNINELLVLASIIEKETSIDSERTLVSSVFINRLIKGMKLQTDPTVIYALTLGKKDLGRLLTRKDLLIDSPYNTYKYYGLPPSPICNPGLSSLKAAANPEISDFLYFVADGQGGHNFAKSLKEHNNNVRAWKKIKK
ncbi:MAG: endolytic transglycosylase MltG [Alphaproteobacteria bacterium]|nr:endolytic transglycosylase MltG [Alphaproteobacteria bacterium]